MLIQTGSRDVVCKAIHNRLSARIGAGASFCWSLLQR